MMMAPILLDHLATSNYLVTSSLTSPLPHSPTPSLALSDHYFVGEIHGLGGHIHGLGGHAAVLTNGEPTAEKIVRPSTFQLSYFPRMDFANFWSGVRY